MRDGRAAGCSLKAAMDAAQRTERSTVQHTARTARHGMPHLDCARQEDGQQPVQRRVLRVGGQSAHSGVVQQVKLEHLRAAHKLGHHGGGHGLGGAQVRGAGALWGAGGQCWMG